MIRSGEHRQWDAHIVRVAALRDLTAYSDFAAVLPPSSLGVSPLASLRTTIRNEDAAQRQRLQDHERPQDAPTKETTDG